MYSVSIAYFTKKIKAAFEHRLFGHCLAIMAVFLLGVIGLELYLLARQETAPPIQINGALVASVAELYSGVGLENEAQISSAIAPTSSNSKKIVASKNGTRYYYLNCSGVGRINEANKVYFSSEAEAEAVGLTLAANCKP